MDEVNPDRELRFFDLDSEIRRRRHDARERLDRTSYASLKAVLENDGAAATDFAAAYTARIRTLARAAGRDTTVFQAVLVASLQTLGRVLSRQRLAATASISLAQGDKMRTMIASTEAMIEALTEALSQQGSKMFRLCAGPAPHKGEPSWWFALTETIQALEEGMERMGALVYGQPRGAPARTLSSLVIRLMHHQHLDLLSEAEHWIS